MPTLLKPTWVRHDGNATLYSIDVHPDNTRFATGGGDGRVRIWNMLPILDQEKEGVTKLLCTIFGHESSVNSVRWSPNGNYLATASTDCSVGIADCRKGGDDRTFGSAEPNIENWKFKHLLRGHQIDVWDVAWSPDSTKLASAGHNGKILVWDIPQAKLLTILEGHSSIVKGLAWDPIGRYLASQEDTAVIFWRTDRWKQAKVITDVFTNASENPLFKRPSWSPDGGALIAAAGVKSKKHIAPQILRESWVTNKGELVGHKAPVTIVHFNPILFASSDGPVSCCAASSLDGVVSLWLTSREYAFSVLRNLFLSPLSDMRWSPNGDTLLMCSQDGTVAACIFHPKELGRKLTQKEMEQHIAQIFGEVSTGDLFENPDLWSMYQNRQKEDSVEHLEPKLEQEEDKLQAAPEHITQIETVSAAGKRRITPVCLQLEPSPQVKGESYVDPPNAFVQTPVSLTPATDDAESKAATQTAEEAPTPPQSSPKKTTEDKKSESEYYGLAAAAATYSGPKPVSADKKRVREDVDAATAETNEEDEAHKRARKTAKIEEKPKAVQLPKKSSSKKTKKMPKNRLAEEESLDANDEYVMVERPPTNRPIFPIPEPGDRLILDLSTSPNLSTCSTSIPYIKESVVSPDTIEVVVMTPSEPNCDQASSHPIQTWSNVSFIAEGEVISRDRIMTRVVLICGHKNDLCILGCISGDIYVYSSAGRRLYPFLAAFSNSVAYLECNRNHLLAVSVDGQVRLWDLNLELIKADTDIRPLLARVLPSSEEKDEAERAPSENGAPARDRPVESFSISDNSEVLAHLANGQVYCYHASMAIWICIYDARWQRKADILGPASGSLAGIQKKYNHSHPIQNFTSLIQLSLVDHQIMNMAHLECQLSASKLLGSPSEYKYWLYTYVRRLVELNCKKKLIELCNSFLGPLKSSPSYLETWKPTMLGMSKRELLQSILPLLISRPELQKIVDYFGSSLTKLREINSSVS